VAVLTQRVWDVRGVTGEFYGEATYDDTSGKISLLHAVNNDSVPHTVIVTWKGQDFSMTVDPGVPHDYTPPNNVKWGQDQFDIRTV
jgi:hypothetical protein